MRILLAGVSVRALAQSAARTGYDVACLDCFGDCDLPPGNHVAFADADGGGSYDASALPFHARRMSYDAVAYVANLENHPSVVEQLGGEHPVIGNSRAVLEAVRHWPDLIDFCGGHGVGMPRTMLERDGPPAGAGRQAWLLKPELSGGGHGIRPWDGSEPEAGWYLQQRVEGIAASAVFEADGKRCRVIGASEQLIGLERFGADGFRYCGNIFPLERPSLDGEAVGRWARETAGKLTRHFGLQGVNGIDFMIPASGDPLLIEVNPRPPASAELMESALGESIFSAHVNPMANRKARPPAAKTFFGKAIVYAGDDVVVPDATTSWSAMHRVDIPRPGQRIKAQHPICTVTAFARTRQECLHRLEKAADSVRIEIGDKRNSGSTK